MCRVSSTVPRFETLELAHEALTALAPAGATRQSALCSLHSLIDEAGEAYALARVPSARAIEGFGRVLRQIECREPPAVSLTASGGIWAEWSGAGGRNVAIFVGHDGRALLEIEGDLETILTRLRIEREQHWLSAAPPHRYDCAEPKESGA